MPRHSAEIGGAQPMLASDVIVAISVRRRAAASANLLIEEPVRFSR
jgi:hypothetical protein